MISILPISPESLLWIASGGRDKRPPLEDV